MFKAILLYFFSFIVTLPIAFGETQHALAAAKVREVPASQLKSVLGKIQGAKSFSAKIEKQTRSMTGDTSKAQGHLYFSKGRFCLELKDESETTVVFDGKILWLAQKFENQWQVTKMPSLAARNSNTLLAALFGNSKFLKTLKVLSVNERSGVTRFQVATHSMPELEVKELTIGTRDQEIALIDYTDEIENKTQYIFLDNETNGLIAKNKFKYRIPKGAEVNTIQ